MRCATYFRIRQNYEAAQRRWTQAAMSAGESPSEQESLMAAFYQRNVARDRLELHEQDCPTCNRINEP
jgi:hypothetical protein